MIRDNADKQFLLITCAPPKEPTEKKPVTRSTYSIRLTVKDSAGGFVVHKVKNGPIYTIFEPVFSCFQDASTDIS